MLLSFPSSSGRLYTGTGPGQHAWHTVLITQVGKCWWWSVLHNIAKCLLGVGCTFPVQVCYHTIMELFFFGKTVLFQNLKRQFPCPSLSIPRFSLLRLCSSYLTQPSHTLFLYTVLLILASRPWQTLNIEPWAWATWPGRGLQLWGRKWLSCGG